MSEYKFAGDISGIADRQLEIINNVLSDNELKNEHTKILFKPVGKPGDNYTSSVKRVTLEDGSEKKSVIVKIAPTNELVRATVNTGILFKNEHTIYTDLLPIFSQLEKSFNLPEEFILRYPKCYGSFCEQPNEVIILEDLNMSNFTIFNRFKPLSDSYVKTILRNFAIYHSLSYALKKEKAETFESLKQNFKDLWSQNVREEMKICYEQLESEVMSVLDDEKHKSIVKNKIIKLSEIAKRLEEDDAGSKQSVILQGDSWTNNFMFRTKDDNNIESIMIDYQLAKEGSPAYDLLYMTFNCTDHQTRMKHFNEWMEYYYTELDKCLSNFDIKVESVFPKYQLDADLKRYAKVILSIAMILSSVLTRKEEDSINLTDSIMENKGDFTKMAKRNTIMSLDDETVDSFKNRVVGLVKSYDELGFS